LLPAVDAAAGTDVDGLLPAASVALLLAVAPAESDLVSEPALVLDVESADVESVDVDPVDFESEDFESEDFESEDFESEDVDSADVDSDPAPDFESDLDSGFLPPSRKSVTYQPEPLSWKPAAVTCFSRLGLPQDGQSVRSASLTFCRASCSKPQAAHR